MSGSLTIRELINMFGFEVDEASFDQAEGAVDKLEQVLVNATAAARGAAVEVSSLVEKLAVVGREASQLGAFNSVLDEWTKSTADATKRLGLMREEAQAAQRAADAREAAARQAEAQSKQSETAARDAQKAAKEQEALAAAAKAASREAEGGFRAWLRVLSDVNQALELVHRVVVSIAAPVTHLVDRSRDLNASAMMLGTSLGSLQEWQYAIQAMGGTADEAEGLGEALLDLSDKMLDASSGEGEQYELFKKIGAEAKDAHTGKLKPLEQFLPELADAFAKVENDTLRAGVASQLLGETGAKVLLPMLMQGSTGMALLSEEARAMGAVLGDETIQSAMEFREEWGRVSAIISSVQNELGAALLPAVRDVVGAVRDWVMENRALISSGLERAMVLFSGAARVVVQVGEPLLRLFRFLAVDGGRWKVLVGALSLALLYYAGTAVMAAVGSSWSFVAAMGAKLAAMKTSLALFGLMTGELKLLTLWETLAGVAGAAAPFLIAAAWGALVILLGAILEDIYTFFTGGESIIGRWGEWILGVININPTDSKLVKFLKFLGTILFDTVGAFEMAGSAIEDVFDSLGNFITRRVDMMVMVLRALADFFINGPVRMVSKLLSGDVAGAMREFQENFSRENAGALLNKLQLGNFGSVPIDFTPERLVGPSASPAAALAASVSSSSNNTSSVFSPSQQLVQHINVGSNATPQEAARASGDGARTAWEEMLRDAQFTAGGGR